MAFGFAMGATTAALRRGQPTIIPPLPGTHRHPRAPRRALNVYGAHGNTAWSGTRTAYSTSGGYGQYGQRWL